MRSVNPASLAVLSEYAEHDHEAVDRLLAAVQQDSRSWSATPIAKRCDALRKLSAVLRGNLSRLALLATDEMGKPIRDAEAEVEKCASACDYYAERAGEFLGPVEIPSDARRSYVAFEPLGVVLGVMPWNFPFWQVFRFAVPALAAGNGGVLKHASNVCGCAIEIEKMFQEAGFPRHLFVSLLVPNTRIRAIIEHPVISAVTVTGSDGAGRAVAETAGRSLKKVVLELGGSDPFIVLPGADLQQVAEQAVAARLVNTGQSCIAAKRFIVLDEMGEQFERAMVEEMGKLRIGDPRDPATQVGPLARPDLVEELHRQVERSVVMGARLRIGGKPAARPGCYYEPTVLTAVRPGMPAFDEETFGPVAAVIRARDEDDALTLANASQWGLGASIWTVDIERATRLASKIEAGMVFINGIVKSDPRLPFGGIKNSGFGRELSVQGIREFTNQKTVWIA